MLVVCSGSSHLPNPGLSSLASPAVVGAASLGVVPSPPLWFHRDLVWVFFQQFKTFSKGGISLTRFIQAATTLAVQAFLKQGVGEKSVLEYSQDFLNLELPPQVWL